MPRKKSVTKYYAAWLMVAVIATLLFITYGIINDGNGDDGNGDNGNGNTQPEPPIGFIVLDSWRVGSTSSSEGWAQAVDSDGTYLYFDENYNLYKYNKQGVLVDSHTDAVSEGTPMEQINGICVYNNFLYITSNNVHWGGPHRGYVKKFTKDLDFMQDWDVSLAGYWAEGVDYHDGYFWVVYHDYSYVAKFTINFQFVETYYLEFPVTTPGIGDNGGYQDVCWVGDYMLCNIHDRTCSPLRCDVYYWNGVSFKGIARLMQPTITCGQGLGLDPSENNILWWADRANPGESYIVKTEITYES